MLNSKDNDQHRLFNYIFDYLLIPGTGVLGTLSASLFEGVRAGVFVSIGCAAGIVTEVLASILGLAVIIQAVRWRFSWLNKPG